jgi:hypothetical protein
MVYVITEDNFSITLEFITNLQSLGSMGIQTQQSCEKSVQFVMNME